MDEEEAQLGSADIALTLAVSHVHGVWEERMPLGLEAALSIGCVTELLPSVRHQPLLEGFMLSALKVEPMTLRFHHWANAAKPDSKSGTIRLFSGSAN